jgi:hypothetical protein
MNVKAVLESYLGGVQLGEPVGPPMTGARDLDAGLLAVSHANERYFQWCFTAVAILLAGNCALAIRFIDDPGRLGALFTVTGVSIAGLVAQMVSLWKQKVTADVVALLARNLAPGDVRGVIEILFAKL